MPKAKAVTDSEPSINQELQWFAMRDLKRANAKLPAYLQLAQAGFEVFTPMRQRITIKDNRRIKETVPVVRDLLFVHSTTELLDPEVNSTPTLQYRYARGKAYRTPVTVHHAEMERFIAAVNSTPQPRYYAPQEITPDMLGHRVRIVGGTFDGFEGNLLKTRGTRRRRLIIDLGQLIAVAVEVEPDFIVPLPE